MKLLLKNALIFDPESKHHKTKADILIDEGMIKQVDQNLECNRSIDMDGKLVSPGLVDLFANFNEPGYEHKEDISSGIECAIFGGFTDVCLIPNTAPVIGTKSDVSFLRSRSDGRVDLYPIAAVSEGTNGENLTEILDLNNAGAVAFSDGLLPIWNSELLLKALQYVQKFNGLIINRAKDIHLSQFSQMHEGEASTSLGMKGEPSLSEEITIKRDLDILRYAGGRMHFTHLSTARAVELILAAKKEGLQVTCDVAIHQLMYVDQHLMAFDSNLKADPPFRAEEDRKALIKGLKTGVIDAITSSHQPQDVESKDLEFDLAASGICSLPTVISSLVKLADELPMEVSIQRFTTGPRRVLGLPAVKVEAGFPAKLAFIDETYEWKFDQSSNPSKSNNSPLFGQILRGKCVGTANGSTLNY